MVKLYKWRFYGFKNLVDDFELEITSDSVVDFNENFTVSTVNEASSEPSSVFETEELLHILSIFKVLVPSSGEVVSRTVQLKFSGDSLIIIVNNRRQFLRYEIKAKNKVNLIEGTWFVSLDFLIFVVRKWAKTLVFIHLIQS